MPLTNTAIQNAKPADKRYKLYDRDNLFLIVNTNGTKWWRCRFIFAGTQKELSVGTWPKTSLKEARNKAAEIVMQAKAGRNPSHERQKAKHGLTASTKQFKYIAESWFTLNSERWRARHSTKVKQRLEKMIEPDIGELLIDEITRHDIVQLLEKLKKTRPAETVRRVHQHLRQIFKYARAMGLVESNPTSDLEITLPPIKHGHFASFTEPSQVGEYLRALDAFKGTYPVKCALLLAPLLFVRPGELRQAKWEEIDLKNAEWKFHVSKTDLDHLVPLSRQAVAIFKDLKTITGKGVYVFPNGRTHQRPMSDAAMNAGLRRLGFDTKTEITSHGVRAMARTLLAERLGYPDRVIEHQLAHRVADIHGRAYNRTQFLDERREMMQKWADYLDTLKAGGESASAK